MRSSRLQGEQGGCCCRCCAVCQMQKNVLPEVCACAHNLPALGIYARCRHRLERDHNCSALAASAATAAAVKSEEDWLKSFGSNSPKFKNAPNSAVGDSKIPEGDRFLLAVNFPQALQRPPLYDQNRNSVCVRCALLDCSTQICVCKRKVERGKGSVFPWPLSCVVLLPCG